MKIRVAICALALPTSTAQAANLSLVCSGSGVGVVTAYSPLGAAHDDVSASSFGAQVRVELTPGSGRISIPASLLPEISSGGQGGWWELYDIAESDREIAAKVRFNWLTKPSVRIDRVTGAIAIDAGRRSFSGQCEAADPAAKPKF